MFGLNGLVYGLNSFFTNVVPNPPMLGHFFHVHVTLPYIGSTSPVEITLLAHNNITHINDRLAVSDTAHPAYGNPVFLDVMVFMPHDVYGTPVESYGETGYKYNMLVALNTGNAVFFAFGTTGYIQTPFVPVGYRHVSTSDYISIRELAPPQPNSTSVAQLSGFPCSRLAFGEVIEPVNAPQHPVCVVEPPSPNQDSDICEWPQGSGEESSP